MEREPDLCLILGVTGGAFTMGALGGSAYHFIKGFRNSPNGTRIAGGLEAMRLNVPHVAGSFAVWSGLFSACDCALVYMRKKEDPWNSIISGAAAGGILSVRQGFHAAVRSSVQGAVTLALISGISVPFNSPVISPVETSSDDGLFNGLFGEKKVEDGSANRSTKSGTWNF